MKFNKEVWLLVLLVLAYLPYLLLRQDIFLYDGYAFLSLLCFSTTYYTSVPGFFALSFLPCNIFIGKLFLFSMYLVLIAGLVVLARLINKKRAIESVFVVLTLAPLTLFQFFMFENEVVAIPIAIWATIFLLYKTKSWIKKVLTTIIGLILLIIAATVWNLIAYYAIALIPMAPVVIVLGLYIAVFYSNSFIGYLDVFSGVIENRKFGLTQILFLPLLVLNYKHKNKLLLVSLAISLVFGLLNAKLFILAVPFFVMQAPYFLDWLEKKDIAYKEYLIALGIVLVFGWSYIGFTGEPTQTDWDLIDTAITTASDNNLPLYNDWSYGHWINWKGYKTSYVGSSPDPDYDLLEKPFVAFTQLDLNCSKIVDNNNLFRPVKVFVCD